MRRTLFPCDLDRLRRAVTGLVMACGAITLGAFAIMAVQVEMGRSAQGVVPAPSEDAYGIHNVLLHPLFLPVAGLVVSLLCGALALSGRALRSEVRRLDRHEQFLVEAAHEVRSPLATMRLLVEEGLRSKTDAAAVLEQLTVRIDAMSTLLAALTLRARVDAGSVEIEMLPLRLDQLVEATTEDMGVGGRIRLTLGGGGTHVVLGNAELLAQVVRNLVDNALRHGSGPVLVAVDGTVLAIEDDGPGIPPAERGPALKPGVGDGRGSGVGLAIVAWVTELHSARLRLGTSGAGGLRVEVRLPAP